MSDLLDQAQVRTGGMRAVHSGQQNQPHGPFHQGAHSRAIASTFQQVAFPVARHDTGGDVGRSFSDRCHVGNLARRYRPRARGRRVLRACRRVASNLLGRAARGQLCGDVLPQPRVEEFTDVSGVMGLGRRVALRRRSAIGTVSGRVPGHLATERAWSSAHDPGHPEERLAVGQAQTQGLTFVCSQVSVPPRVHGNTIAHLGCSVALGVRTQGIK